MSGSEPEAGLPGPAPGTDFYYASLYHAPAARREMHAIEALRRELAAIPLDCSDRGVAHVKLAWWREEIARLGSGAPRHRLTGELGALAARDAELPGVFARLVDAVEAGLADDVPERREDVHAAIDAVHGEVAVALARRGGAVDAREQEAMRGIAARVELAYDLHGLRRHRRRGTLHVAREALAAHGLEAADVRHAARSEAIDGLVREEITRVRAELDDALAALPRGLRRRVPLFPTLGRIAARALELTLADGCRVLEQRVEPTPLEKLWLAWRTRYLG